MTHPPVQPYDSLDQFIDDGSDDDDIENSPLQLISHLFAFLLSFLGCGCITVGRRRCWNKIIPYYTRDPLLQWLGLCYLLATHSLFDLEFPALHSAIRQSVVPTQLS